MTQINIEDLQLRVSAAPTDQISISERVSYILKPASTPPPSKSTLPQQVIQLLQPQEAHRKVTCEDIQDLANTKYQSTGKGLIYKDLLKGYYKRAHTPKQAQNILKYHKKKGNLHSNIPITIPQEYFYTKDHAMLAATTNKRSTLPDPTGVGYATHALAELEDQKAESLYEAIDLAARYCNAGIPTGLHNIRVHVTLNNPAEAYHERLDYHNNPHVFYTLHANKEKRIETQIDSYLVQASVFPSGKVVIAIPCSDKPFPITMSNSAQTTSDFNALIAQIRYFLVDCFRDFRGSIVPPIHSAAWRLVHADINWDIPTTALNFLKINDIQITKVNDIILRVYKKMLNAKTYVRVEEGTHAFKNIPIGTDAIGPTLVSAAEQAAQRLKLDGDKERPFKDK